MLELHPPRPLDGLESAILVEQSDKPLWDDDFAFVHILLQKGASTDAMAMHS
jgi:hypothetical protein